MLKPRLKRISQQAIEQYRCCKAEVASSNDAIGGGARQRHLLARQSGFTLIELMVAVVVVAILTMLAIASYQYFADKKDLATAQQEVQNIAAELEKFKAKNFSYKGFAATYLYGAAYNTANGELSLPLNVAASEQKYTIHVLDLETGSPLTVVYASDGSETESSESVLGLSWLITATRKQEGGAALQPNNYDLLLTSTGLRCQSKTNNAFEAFDAGTDAKCSDIDSNSEVW